MIRTMLVALGGLMAGCGEGPYAAPSWATIDAGEDIRLAASPAFIDADNEGALVAVEVMVLDGRSGTPMNDIEVEVASGWSGVYVLPEGAVTPVADPDAGPLGPNPDPADVEADCDAGDGADAWCAWYWDILSGRYHEIGTTTAAAASFVAGTGERGVLRFSLFVNDLPTGDSADTGTADYQAVTVRASIQVDTDSFSILVE